MKKPTLKDPVTAVPKLRAINQQSGQPCFRPIEVEESLAALYALDRSVVAKRSKIIESIDPDFVRPECIVHFVRQKRSNHSQDAVGVLFKSLRQRVLRGARIPWSRSHGETDEEKEAFEQDVGDFVLDHFLDLFKEDAKGYDNRLDHFEIKFNQAIKLDRIDAANKARRRPKLVSFGESGVDNFDPGAENQFVAIFQNKIPDSEEITYRNELIAAINQLPDGEREVMQLVVMEHSNVEIAKLLECDKKTVYHRKKRARARLKEWLGEESNE
ncbi:MAG: sigma factor-like helix-turn-helix DNA-binding protein [Planctomycetota bacterium]